MTPIRNQRSQYHYFLMRRPSWCLEEEMAALENEAVEAKYFVGPFRTERQKWHLQTL